MNKSPGKVRIGAIAVLSAAAVAILALAAGDARAQTPNGWGWPTASGNPGHSPAAAGTVHSLSGAGNLVAVGGQAQAVILAAPNPLASTELNAVASAARRALASRPDRRRRRLPITPPSRCVDPQVCGKAIAPHPMLTLGRPISGVGADGMPSSLIVVWDSEISVGDQFTISLYNDDGELSTSANEDGGLGQLGGGSATANSVTVSAISTDSGILGIAVYQAPVDFVRPPDSSNPNAPSDPGATSRQVDFEIQDDTNDIYLGYLPFTVLRPPVVLVHGLWGAPSDWSGFSPFLTDSRFSVQQADFSNNIGSQITSFYPIYDPNAFMEFALEKAVSHSAKANSLGFAYNAPTVLNQIGSAISSFQNGGNPLGLSVASIQADLVVHSMGGDISRYLPLLPNFYTGENFGQGSVHKVVTIDTPHLGSPLAYDMLQSGNLCLAELFTLAGHATFSAVDLGPATVVSGAIGDLSVNPADGTLSFALQTVHQSSTPRLPTALIASIMGSAQLDPIGSPPAATQFMIEACGYQAQDPLALDLTPALWPTVFGSPTADSDAIVSLTSQFDGLSGMGPPFTAVHSGGVQDLGFGGPNALEEASGVPDQVINLLNTPVTNTSTFLTTLP
jgi:pimeloyl-ACP methyl ester carboxylesterase